MTAVRPLLLLTAVFLFAGCERDVRPEAERTLQSIGVTTLRREAATFYKDFFTAPEGRYFVPNVDKCPPSFRSFNPIRVRAYPDGFAIALDESHGVEQGLYVVPLSMDDQPRAGRSAEFEKIAEGVYWFRFAD
jgi:hypothetical protein